jgi:hypothetical protein
MMRVAEIVEAAHGVHAGFQGFGFLNQSAGSASQAVEPLAKSGVEPLDKGGVDIPVTLRLLDEPLHHPLTALDDAPGDVELTLAAMLDDLNDSDIGPRNQLRTALLARTTRQGSSEGSAKSGDVAG